LFSSEHTRYISDNRNQRTLVTLAKGFGIELKIHFRNDLFQFGYNDSSPKTTFFLRSLKVTL